MNATDLTPDHPTEEMVLAALNAAHREQYRSWGRVNPETGEVQWADRTHLGEFADAVVKQARAALTAALPHLTAATEENLARLRDTPVGRALMAEAWEEGVLDQMGQRRRIMSPEVVSIVRERIASANPYKAL